MNRRCHFALQRQIVVFLVGLEFKGQRKSEKGRRQGLLEILNLLSGGPLSDAPNAVERRNQFDRLGKVGWFGKERVGTEFVRLFDHCRRAVAREDHHWQAMQSRNFANVFQNT